MMKMKRHIMFLVIIIIASSCKPKKVEVPATLGDIDVTSTVAIGGNSFAGYSDDALHLEGQEYSIPSIILDRMEESNQFNPFTLPYLSSSSNGINLNGDSKLILGYKTDCNNETSLSPIRKAVSGNVDDLNNWVSMTPYRNIFQEAGNNKLFFCYYWNPFSRKCKTFDFSCGYFFNKIHSGGFKSNFFKSVVIVLPINTYVIILELHFLQA